MKLLLDTNILIDYLNGLEVARAVVEHNDPYAISLITMKQIIPKR